MPKMKNLMPKTEKSSPKNPKTPKNKNSISKGPKFDFWSFEE